MNIDEDLFRQIGQDNMEAFEKLYNITERTMYAYIMSIVKNHEDTLDIMQETYLKIRSAAHLYKPMGKPLSWMFTIAKNIARNKFKLENRTIDSNDLDLENKMEFSYIQDPIDKMVLKSALTILSEDERKIVLLYAVTGMKHREIASNLGIPLSTALSKYRRALKKLRVHLSNQGVNVK